MDIRIESVSSGMILWLPLIMLRSLIVGRRVLWIDGLLLLAGAICIMAQNSALEIESSWRNFPVYVLFGIITFMLSVSVTASHPIDYLLRVMRVARRQEMNVHKRAVLSSVITALSEEFVWRVVFQTVLSMAVGIDASVAVVAASFALLHRRRTLGFSIQFAELLAFSLVLGVLFALSHDVLLVITVHFVRNYLIAIQGDGVDAR